MNIPTNDNIKSRIEQQAAEQTILLDAIRNKFANNENHSGTSPPVFSIPNLKFPQFAPTSLDNDDKSPPSKLNQFILDKLSECNPQTTANASSFKIPDLKTKNEFGFRSLTLADKLNLDETSRSESKINFLNRGISKLSVCDEQKTHVIDLTTALNQSTVPASPSKQMIRPIPNPIDFQIPFIDCDIKEKTLCLPMQDEYCLTDISAYTHRRFISSPSRFGKITCLKYRAPKSSTIVDHSFVKKHSIIRFGFDTKSPDDIILGSLRRCNRV